MGRCPVEIPVAGYMQYYNDKLLGGKTDVEMAKELDNQKKLGFLVGARPAGDCVACGRCETACTQHLDIVRRLNTLAEWEQQPAWRK